MWLLPKTDKIRWECFSYIVSFSWCCTKKIFCWDIGMKVCKFKVRRQCVMFQMAGVCVSSREVSTTQIVEKSLLHMSATAKLRPAVWIVRSLKSLVITISALYYLGVRLFFVWKETNRGPVSKKSDKKKLDQEWKHEKRLKRSSPSYVDRFYSCLFTKRTLYERTCFLFLFYVEIQKQRGQTWGQLL